jgi:protein CrcB
VNWLLVIAGAMVGAPLRYLTDRTVQAHHDPSGTFTFNVPGCLILGLVSGAVTAGAASSQVQPLLDTGLCGALSTYSTFSYETLRLTEQGAGFFAAANVVASVVAGLGTAFRPNAGTVGEGRKPLPSGHAVSGCLVHVGPTEENVMTATTDVLIPALREVREAEAAVADRLRAHATVAPAAEYRETLECRIGDARGHVRRIDERLKTLQPWGLVRTVFGGAVHLTGMAVRLPFEVAMGVPAALLRGKATQRQLLKNTEREYGVTAFAVATCRAGEHIAQEIGDTDSWDLLDSIRRDDENLLEQLGLTLEQRAEAVVAATATDGWEPVDLTDAAQAVRTGAGRVRETAERWEQKARDAQGARARRAQ